MSYSEYISAFFVQWNGIVIAFVGVFFFNVTVAMKLIVDCDDVWASHSLPVINYMDHGCKYTDSTMHVVLGEAVMALYVR